MKHTTDHNSSVNQTIKSKFVDRDVLCCVTSLVCDLLEKDEKQEVYEEIENLYTYYVDGEQYSEGQRSEKIEEVQEQIANCPDDNEELSKALESQLEALQDAESEPQEVLEWWAVSKWLFKKLREHGEPVLDYGTTHIWGRTCSGQAIMLDGVISEICEELEILEGQARDWSKQ